MKINGAKIFSFLKRKPQSDPYQPEDLPPEVAEALAGPVPEPSDQTPSSRKPLKSLMTALAALLTLAVLGLGGFVGYLWREVPVLPNDPLYLEQLIPAGSLGALVVNDPYETFQKVSESHWAKNLLPLLKNPKIEGQKQKFQQDIDRLIQENSLPGIKAAPGELLGSRCVISGFLRVGKPRLRYLALTTPTRKLRFVMALKQKTSKMAVLQNYAGSNILDLGGEQYAAVIGAVLAFSNDQGLLKNAIDLAKTPGASLGQDGRYRKLCQTAGQGPILGFVSYDGILEALKPYMALMQAVPASSKIMTHDAMVFRISLEKGVTAHYQTLWRKPFTPQAEQMIKLSPKTFTIAQAAPESSVLVQDVVWDPQGAWAMAEAEMAKATHPWHKTLAAWDKKLRLKKGILPVLGSEMGMILQMNGHQDNSVQGFEFPNAMVLFQAKDVAKLSQAVKTAWALWGQNNPKTAKTKKAAVKTSAAFQSVETPYKKIPVHTVKVVPGGNAFFDISPSYCFLNDFLVLSLNRAGCEALIDVSKGEAPALTNAADFKNLGLSQAGLSLFYLDLEGLVMGIVNRTQKWLTLLAAGSGKSASVPPELLSWSKPLGVIMEHTEEGLKGSLVWPMVDLKPEQWAAIGKFTQEAKSYKPPMMTAVPVPEPKAVPQTPPPAPVAAAPAKPFDAVPAAPTPAPVPQAAPKVAKAAPAPAAPPTSTMNAMPLEVPAESEETSKSKTVTLELMNGQSVTGELVEENPEECQLFIAGLGTVSFSKKEILSIER